MPNTLGFRDAIRRRIGTDATRKRAQHNIVAARRTPDLALLIDLSHLVTVVDDYFAADAPVKASISSILGAEDSFTFTGCSGDNLAATASDKQ